MGKTFNPGKNHKDQPCRAKNHHTGKINTTSYTEDSCARACKLSKRLKTIQQKIKELSNVTNTQLKLTYVTESGREGTFQTDNWKHGGGSCVVNCDDDGEEREVPTTLDIGAKYPDPPKVNTNKHDGADGTAAEDTCQLCGKQNMRKGKTDIWVQCEFTSHGLPCNYWCHSICAGFIVNREKDLEKIQFYCPVHIKAFKKV